jgi:hypothetical protein
MRSKIKIRTSLRHKANLALDINACRNEVRIWIFDDPAEQEERKYPQFRYAQLNSRKFSRFEVQSNIGIVIQLYSCTCTIDSTRVLLNLVLQYLVGRVC